MLTYWRRNLFPKNLDAQCWLPWKVDRGVCTNFRRLWLASGCVNLSSGTGTRIAKGLCDLRITHAFHFSLNCLDSLSPHCLHYAFTYVKVLSANVTCTGWCEEGGSEFRLACSRVGYRGWVWWFNASWVFHGFWRSSLPFFFFQVGQWSWNPISGTGNFNFIKTVI